MHIICDRVDNLVFSVILHKRGTHNIRRFFGHTIYIMYKKKLMELHKCVRTVAPLALNYVISFFNFTPIVIYFNACTFFTEYILQ